MQTLTSLIITHSYLSHYYTPSPLSLLHILISLTITLPYLSHYYTSLPLLLLHSLIYLTTTLPYLSYYYKPSPLSLLHILISLTTTHPYLFHCHKIILSYHHYSPWISTSSGPSLWTCISLLSLFFTIDSCSSLYSVSPLAPSLAPLFFLLISLLSLPSFIHHVQYPLSTCFLCL